MVEFEEHQPQEQHQDESFSVDQMETLQESDKQEEEYSLGLGNLADDDDDELDDDDSNGRPAKELYTNESRRVRWMGWIMVAYLLVAGIVCTCLTAWTLRHAQDVEYEQAVTAAALTLSDALGKDLQGMLGALDLFAQDLVLMEEQQQWPTVTMPNFAAKASRLHQLLGTEQITLLPVVPVSQQQSWENYALAHLDWLDASLIVQQQQQQQQQSDDNTDGFMDQQTMLPTHATSISSTIQTGDRTNDGGYYFPAWQTFPVSASTVEMVNVDWYSAATNPAMAESLQHVLDTLQPVLGPLQEVPSKWHATQWQSQLLYPVTTNDGRVVAILAGAIAWEEKVHDNQSSISNHVVETAVSSSCRRQPISGNDDEVNRQHQSILLTSEGTRASAFIPEHDLQVSVYLSDTISLSSNGRDDAPCRTIVEVYPMNHVRDDYYYTGQPLWAALACLSIFLVAITLWTAYSRLVAKRQQLVMKRAVKSTALVSSLFPDAIRDRLLQGSHAVGLEFREGSTETDQDYDDEEDRNTDKGTSVSPKPQGHSANETSESTDGEERSPSGREPPKMRLKTFLRDTTAAPSTNNLTGGGSGTTSSNHVSIETKPIADFFPNCTVMFADIAGFTAWSSQREPHQVFTLLQNLYSVFDRAAKKRGVFKVETIGDSYVAVTGLPDAQKHHALIMARFAMECKLRMRDVTKKLVKSLGPETEDLRMRFGLHSGPVTAGVLRGARSRFQLFGDTVNTAARMESCGEADRIQMSEATADLLIAAGKGNMVTPRDELIQAKGKGTMRVYWLEENHGLSRHNSQNRRASLGSSTHSSIISFGIFSSAENLMNSESLYDLSTVSASFKEPHRPSNAPPSGIPIRHTGSRPNLMWGGSEEMLSITKFRRNTSSSTQRLIEWNCALLMRLLQQVVTKRLSSTGGKPKEFFCGDLKGIVALRDHDSERDLVSEVAELIPMPNFEPDATNGMETQAMLSLEVENQLHSYVAGIASMYRDNPFHNYEHACHVQMSMSKLLERVVNPDNIDYESSSEQAASHAHNYTYGITSDPLTQFAVVFCALIHDVDHTGVSNGQLIKEKAHIASLYKNKSVAEQNSIDLAWDLLMHDSFRDLRNCIYSTEEEFKRFRQLVVNTVLATDIFDKELSSLRKNRWNKAFNDDDTATDDSPSDAANRKATIVIEHLIQASDVSHTMQHWDIYRKWNEKLFFEMNLAYKSGRTETDPSFGWYKGELWFFDNYVIPLAKKLDNCGVFGVCSDECLVYALENRQLWELHGEKIVEEMLATDYFKKQKEEEEKKEKENEENKRRRRGGQRKARGLETKALQHVHDEQQAESVTP